MFGKTVRIRHCPATVSATLCVWLDETLAECWNLKATGEIREGGSAGSASQETGFMRQKRPGLRQGPFQPRSEGNEGDLC
jgi:hypothetical protein